MTRLNQPTDNTIKIDPKCLNGFSVAYSATGYILPCCYADNHNIEDFSELMTEDMMVDNNDDIEDIVYSDQWLEFYNKLKTNSKDAPRACKYYCGSDWWTKQVKF